MSKGKPRESSSSALGLLERKQLGAFYTPREMSEFLTAWAIRSPDDVAIDPSCGDAAFLTQASRRLSELGARSPGKQLFGIDLNPEALRQSAAELDSVGAKGAHLFAGSFFDFGTSSLFSQKLPSFDAVIGNPPYVRYQLFKDADRAAGLKAASRQGVILPQLSSSWAPFVVHAVGCLKENGRFAMVLPGELLHVGYAAAVRTFLTTELKNVTVVAFDEKVFPGALEEVVLVLGEKGKGDGSIGVRSLKDVSELSFTDVIRGARRCDVSPGQRWITTLIEQSAIETARTFLTDAKFSTLGSLARVDIGVVTGANDFFFLSRKQVAEKRLPVTVLLPSVSKASHIAGARFTFGDWFEQLQEDAPSYLLLVDENAATNPAVASYLREGELASLPSRYKCRVRDPWYSVPYVKRPDLFLSYMSHISPRLVVNEAGAVHSNTVHGVFLSDPTLAEPLAAAFLNSGTLLSAEIEGRSYGGGVLKLEPGEAVRLMVPKLTPSVIIELSNLLPTIDGLVRAGEIDQASAIVDRVVLGKRMKKAAIEQVRSVLAALRSRRFSRGRTS